MAPAYKYLAIALLFVLAALVPAGMIAVARLAGRPRTNPAKMTPFECGNEPIGDPRRRFSVQFFLIALLFIVFDVEVVFVYPWAVLFRRLGFFGFVEMAVFLFVLAAGLFYVWKKGALEWER